MKVMTHSAKNSGWLGAMLLAGAAHAGDCDVTVSQTQIDFGTFNRGTLSQVANGMQTDVIGKKSARVTVVCPKPENIAVFYRAAASGAGGGYQMGDLAHVTLVASDAQADGKSVSLAYKQQGGSAPEGTQHTLPILPNIGLRPAVSEPVARFSFLLTSVAAVNDVNQPVKERKNLSSNGTLEVVSD